jgi:hypothetical protein
MKTYALKESVYEVEQWRGFDHPSAFVVERQTHHGPVDEKCQRCGRSLSEHGELPESTGSPFALVCPGDRLLRDWTGDVQPLTEDLIKECFVEVHVDRS